MPRPSKVPLSPLGMRIIADAAAQGLTLGEVGRLMSPPALPSMVSQILRVKDPMHTTIARVAKALDQDYSDYAQIVEAQKVPQPKRRKRRVVR